MTLKICKWLFLLLIISLPLVRPFNIFAFGLLIPFTDFIFLAVAAFWMISLIRGETRIEYSTFYFFLGVYGLALTISTIFSIHPQKSFYKLLGEFYLFGLAIVTFNLVRDTKFIKQMTFAWLIATSLTILSSIAGFVLFYIGYKTQADNYFLSHFGSLPAGNYPRIHALFANANMMTNYLNVSFLLALLALKIGWLRKIWAWILLAGISFAGLFTFSAGLGGIILSSGIWFWAILKSSKNPLFSKLALASAVVCAALVFGSTLVSPDTNNSTSDFSVPFTQKTFEPSVRVLVWENAFENYRYYPFFGRGTGANAATVQYQTLSGDNQVLLDAHNVWLNILGQTGLFGLIAFLSLIVYLITRCRFYFDIFSEPRLIQIALSCTFVGAFLYQGLSGSFEDARHLWILFGMLVGISTFSKNDISEESPTP